MKQNNIVINELHIEYMDEILTECGIKCSYDDLKYVVGSYDNSISAELEYQNNQFVGIPIKEKIDSQKILNMVKICPECHGAGNFKENVGTSHVSSVTCNICNGMGIVIK